MALARLYAPRPVVWLVIAYVELMRGTPLLLQLIYIYYVLPELGIRLDAFTASVIGLTLNYSAYISEVYRSGIQGIAKGQGGRCGCARHDPRRWPCAGSSSRRRSGWSSPRSATS